MWCDVLSVLLLFASHYNKLSFSIQPVPATDPPGVTAPVSTSSQPPAEGKYLKMEEKSLLYVISFLPGSVTIQQ